MANGITNGDNIKQSWLLNRLIAILQLIILIVLGVMFNDLREVRDGYLKFGVKQEGLITDVNNVEYNVQTLNNTVQRLVGHEEAKNH